MATCDIRTTAIDSIANTLRSENKVTALFLSGSYGAALQDEYSDIDFLLATAGGASDEVAEIWHKAIRRIGEIVLWRDRQVGPALVNVITEAWLRIDVVILKPEQMAAHTKDKIRVLFDHGGIYERLSENAESPSPDLRRAGYQFEEFIRILGLLAIAAGREEYINGVTGVFHLRNLLVDPLVQETAAPYRGGALHLNRLITDEQKELLTSLPPAVATRGALIDAHLAYAQAYLPRARRLARAWGVEWPERFEAATWKQLHETLSIQPPHQLGDPQPLRT